MLKIGSIATWVFACSSYTFRLPPPYNVYGCVCVCVCGSCGTTARGCTRFVIAANRRARILSRVLQRWPAENRSILRAKRPTSVSSLWMEITFASLETVARPARVGRENKFEILISVLSSRAINVASGALQLITRLR